MVPLEPSETISPFASLDCYFVASQASVDYEIMYVDTPLLLLWYLHLNPRTIQQLAVPPQEGVLGPFCRVQFM